MDTFKDYINSFFGILVILTGLIAIPEIRQRKKYWILAVVVCCIMLYFGIDKINRDSMKDISNQKKSDRDSVRIKSIQLTLDKVNNNYTNDTARFENFKEELRDYNIKDSSGHPTYINIHNTNNTNIKTARDVKIGGF